MKLASNGETLAESKVLILYILNSVKKSITNNALYKIVLSVLDMNYFYFQQFLLDLVKSDFVFTYDKEDHHMYLITDKGIKTLELTEDILPGILKLQVDTNLKYALDDVNEENSIVAEYTPVSENYYNVTCKIMENNECLFEVQTFAGSREQAKLIVDNWKKHAGIMYPSLLEILTQDFGDETVEEEITYKAYHDKKILIVDDSKINLKVAETLMKPYNFEMDTAISGYEAIEKVNNKHYDLIFMDIMMPKLNGVETLDKLREKEDFTTPVVALTADAIEGTDEKYLSVGFNSYLSKPIDRKLLNKVINKYLGGN